jgi:hypothetical protein
VFRLEKKTTEISEMLKQVYGERVMSRVLVFNTVNSLPKEGKKLRVTAVLDI